MASSIKPPLEFNTLYFIKHPGLKAITLRFRNVHAFTWTRNRQLEQLARDIPQPLAPKILSRYAEREVFPFWWSCIAKKEAPKDRVVRSWLARRTRNAFEESLKKKGYDTYGRPLPEAEVKKNLYGTAHLSVNREAAKVSFEELVLQTDIAVSEIQRQTNRAHEIRAQKRKANQDVRREEKLLRLGEQEPLEERRTTGRTEKHWQPKGKALRKAQ